MVGNLDCGGQRLGALFARVADAPEKMAGLARRKAEPVTAFDAVAVLAAAQGLHDGRWDSPVRREDLQLLYAHLRAFVDLTPPAKRNQAGAAPMIATANDDDRKLGEALAQLIDDRKLPV
jgi:hypothetical protein